MENDAADFDLAVEFVQGLIDKAAAFLPSAVGALVVLVVGLWIARTVLA